MSELKVNASTGELLVKEGPGELCISCCGIVCNEATEITVTLSGIIDCVATHDINGEYILTGCTISDPDDCSWIFNDANSIRILLWTRCIDSDTKLDCMLIYGVHPDYEGYWFYNEPSALLPYTASNNFILANCVAVFSLSGCVGLHEDVVQRGHSGTAKVEVTG